MTCSRSCVKEHKSSSNNGNWRGGTSHYRAAETHSGKNNSWRQAVLDRDKHTCVQCNSTEHLRVDHIKPWALYPELRYVVSNGRVLCDDCHKTTYKLFFEERKRLEAEGYERPVPVRIPIVLTCVECKAASTKNSSRDRFCSSTCQVRDAARTIRARNISKGLTSKGTARKKP